MGKTKGRVNGDGDVFLCPLSPVQLTYCALDSW
jgi:hypothetical protein